VFSAHPTTAQPISKTPKNYHDAGPPQNRRIRQERPTVLKNDTVTTREQTIPDTNE
jgi:hypothetical protein